MPFGCGNTFLFEIKMPEIAGAKIGKITKLLKDDTKRD
jgi:hypothetical protein